MQQSDPTEDTPIQPVLAGTEQVREADKVMIVLSYLGIFALIPLLTVKDSPFVTWHAKNGLVLGLGGAFALAILSALIGWIPLLGALTMAVLWMGWLVLHVMGIVKGLRGERWRIPGVTDVAEKL